MPTRLKPYNPSRSDLKHYWHVVDADGQTLGRMATDIAVKLMGKHRPDYVPHMLSGDFVVVVNASKVRVSGKKAEQKKYRRHSGYPGNLKEVPYARVMERAPERIIEHAVRGMLPKNKLGKKAIRRLKVYSGAEHPHEAQIIGSERSVAKLDPVLILDDIEVVAEEQVVVESAVSVVEVADDATVDAVTEDETNDEETTVEEPVQSAEDQDEPAVAEVGDGDESPDNEAAQASNSLSDLGLDERILSALVGEGIETVPDILSKSDDELIAIRGFGAKSLEKLDAALSEAGYSRG